MKKEKFVLIDGNALIHRGYHALPPLTTKSGELVNAVYGFSIILLKVLGDIKPCYVAVAFDRPEPTFRHKEYKEYKATRQKAPQELYDQIPRVKEVAEAMNIPIYEKVGYEADDIVGTLAEKITQENEDIEPLIVTGDLDELQLVDDKTKVYTMKRGFVDTVIYGPEQVKERYGFAPDHLADYKALRGDPSDNIPGVPGIGEKTAVELIKKYQSIEEIYKNLSNGKLDAKEKVIGLLEKNRDKAFLSKRLATIVKNIPLKVDLKQCHIQNYDRDRVVNLFQELGFKSLLKKLPRSHDQEQVSLFEGSESKEENITRPAKKFSAKYEIIDTKESLKRVVAELKKQKCFVIDTETDALDQISPKLIGISLAWDKSHAHYLAIGNKGLNLEEAIAQLKPVLENKKIDKCGHNLKYDYNVLRYHGVKMTPLAFDTMIAAYLLNPGDRRFNLDDLAFSELGYEMVPLESLIGSGKNQKRLSEIDTEKLAQYSCEDVLMSLLLKEHLEPELKKNGFWNLFCKIEMPLVAILAEMEKTGVSIDSDYLKEISSDFSKEINEITEKIHKVSKTKFNISSTQQLKEVLFEKMKLSTEDIKKTKTGFSTAASELDKLRGKHKIIDYVSQYRELTKLKNTYVDALPKMVREDTGKLHTSFNQTITATGRLSSSEPNLQNIPIRTEIGRKIRKAFIAPEGHKLVSVDYSQIELRIVAHVSGDKNMTEAFRRGEDIHVRTAAEVNKIPISKVTFRQRRNAKAVNFGIIYGLSPHGLATQIGVTHEEAYDYICRYFEIHPGVKKYVEKTVKDARASGYVETCFGRRRYLPDINSSNMQVKNAAERMAINFPAQGAAADIMKKAMIEVDKEMAKISAQSKITLQVHDELVLEVPKKDIRNIAHFLEKTMESVVKLKVPIQVDISVGDNWRDMKEIIKGDKGKTKDYQH